MPEGDTIHRTALRLRPALAGRRLVRFEAVRLVGERPAVGETVDAVEARGKHLLVHFGGGLSLRTHMRMTGAWHLYREGERWQKPPHLARVVIEVDDGWVAVCFQAPVVETFRRGGGEPAPLAGLGPDLAADAVDLEAVVARCRAVAEPVTEIGDALLDQRIAAGVGNVYKSEVCFLHGLDPFTPVERVPDEALRSLYGTAHRLLRANLHHSGRVTYRGGLAVHGRRGRPCRRCGTPIRMRHQGAMARTTYWCPCCQPSNRMQPPPIS